MGWDDYFLGIAHAVAAKSKDPACQVGAILVNEEHLIISTGYNGFARNIEDLPWVLEDRFKKLNWVVHAEHNAVLNAARLGVCTAGCTLYVDKFPCFRCLQVIVQAGVARICTDDNDYWKHDPDDADASKKRYVIERSGLKITAPKHPSYRPTAFPESAPGPSLRKGGTVPPAPDSTRTG